MDDEAILPWAALIMRLRANDEQALRTVMEARYDDVVAIAYHYVRTYDLAHDVAQQVFIGLWGRRHTLREDGSLIGYLRRAARNTALKLLAHDASAARLEEALAREYMAVRPHDENLGLSDVEAAEFNARVQSVLSTLSPRVREVALLYHERGLDPIEIATMLDIAPATVYVQLRKATQALELAFRDHRPDPKTSR